MKVIIVEGSGKMVYCDVCGAVAGTPTECPDRNTHEFSTTTVAVYCSVCGAIPGEPTKCPGRNRHEFVKVK
ncbi:MAG: hypothetical protein GXX96_36045 [Planctomycetaceae bacterium]|nr:hypothetical protein [Planctomycetaceae bacterium]